MINWDDKISLTNYGMATFVMSMGFLAAFRARRMFGLSEDAKHLCEGLMLMAGGFAVHQAYWAFWKNLHMQGKQSAQWFVEHAYLLSVPYLSVFVGAAFVAFALVRRDCLLQSRIRQGTDGKREQWLLGMWAWILLMALVWIAIFMYGTI